MIIREEGVRGDQVAEFPAKRLDWGRLGLRGFRRVGTPATDCELRIEDLSLVILAEKMFECGGGI